MDKEIYENDIWIAKKSEAKVKLRWKFSHNKKFQSLTLKKIEHISMKWKEKKIKRNFSKVWKKKIK